MNPQAKIQKIFTNSRVYRASHEICEKQDPSEKLSLLFPEIVTHNIRIRSTLRLHNSFIQEHVAEVVHVTGNNDHHTSQAQSKVTGDLIG
jgi:hypothetical protein